MEFSPILYGFLKVLFDPSWSETGAVRPGLDTIDLAIGPFKPGMDGRLVPPAKTEPVRADIGLLMHELGPFIFRWALSGMGCVLFGIKRALLGFKQALFDLERER